MSFKKTLAAAGLLAVSTFSSATVINGSGLQNGLNNITNGNFFDVQTSQQTPDEQWTVNASGGSVNSLIFEFAGFRNIAEFGVYDLNDSNNRVSIFQGSDTGALQSGSQAFGLNIELLLGFGTTFTAASTGESKVFSSNNFGYYLNSGAGTFFSESALNGDSDNDGIADDHLVAFQGDGLLELDLTGGTSFSPFGANEFILAWEDLPLASADRDYADFVVLVESVTPVSEPGTLALMGLGLAGLGFARRKTAKA